MWQRSCPSKERTNVFALNVYVGMTLSWLKALLRMNCIHIQVIFCPFDGTVQFHGSEFAGKIARHMDSVLKCAKLRLTVKRTFMKYFCFCFLFANMAEPSTKRRRTGGVKQRLAAMEREEPSELSGKDISSELAHSFLMKWAWGFLSPQDVQEYSAKACRDFRALQTEPPSDLDFLANIGTKGQYKCLG